MSVIADVQALNKELRELAPYLDRLREIRAMVEAGKLGSLHRRLALVCHPDRGGGDGALMADVNNLFEILEGRILR